MDFPLWLHHTEDLLLPMDGEAALQEVLDRAHLAGSQFGVVSKKYPLLSGLTVAENLALWNMYHRNLSLNLILRRFTDVLERLGVAAGPFDRVTGLSSRDVFALLLARCLASESQVIVLLAPRRHEAQLALELMAGLSPRPRLWVLCLAKRAEAYHDLPLKRLDTTPRDRTRPRLSVEPRPGLEGSA